MSELRDQITSDLDAIYTEWPDVHNQTKAKLSNMPHYGNIHDKSEVVKKTKSDRRNLEPDLKMHENLAARGKNIKRDLETQVESSENRVQRLKKHGRRAVVGFALMGAGIGGALGAKAPGWGQVAAIAVGAVLGFIVFAVVALFMYFMLRWKFTKSRDMWKQVENENWRCVELIDSIDKKKSDLSEIRSRLDDIEEDNMVTALPMFREKRAEYLK